MAEATTTEEKYKIILDDKTVHTIDPMRFITIKNLCDDIDDDSIEIPIPGIKKEIFDYIIEFMELHHKSEDEVNKTEEGQHELRIKPLSETDNAYFAKLGLQNHFNLILAANYLDFKLLLDYSCKAIAEMIKGKDPSEIKKIFGVESDFTEEEKAQVLVENPWLKSDDEKSSLMIGIEEDAHSGGGGAAE